MHPGGKPGKRGLRSRVPPGLTTMRRGRPPCGRRLWLGRGREAKATQIGSSDRRQLAAMSYSLDVSLRRGGLEPSTVGLEIRCSDSVTRNAEASYESSEAALTDFLTALSAKQPDLASVVTAWPGLSDAVRARIVGIVEGATASKATE